LSFLINLTLPVSNSCIIPVFITPDLSDFDFKTYISLSPESLTISSSDAPSETPIKASGLFKKEESEHNLYTHWHPFHHEAHPH